MKKKDLNLNNTIVSDQNRGEPKFAELLLAWYDQNSRMLPWRQNPDAYWIWISEIMLQQTRMNTAIPYFHRFVESFPNISILANAEESFLLKHWEGLGYYSRVKNIQKAAKMMLERYDAKVPASFNELIKLPGIGEYTAGAIASTAYQIPVTAVDGNVLRVMARLLCFWEDIALPQSKKILRTKVEEILPKDRPGDFNQALMELGAMVCMPNTQPSCNICPLQKICIGYREGVSSELPIKSALKPRIIQQKTVLIVVFGDKILLRKRSDTGLLAGLWEFPNVDGWLEEKNVGALLEDLGILPLKIVKTQNARHVFTHIEWHMSGYLIYAKNEPFVLDNRWVEAKEIQKDYTLPSAFKAFTSKIPAWIE